MDRLHLLHQLLALIIVRSALVRYHVIDHGDLLGLVADKLEPMYVKAEVVFMATLVVDSDSRLVIFAAHLAICATPDDLIAALLNGKTIVQDDIVVGLVATASASGGLWTNLSAGLVRKWLFVCDLGCSMVRVRYLEVQSRLLGGSVGSGNGSRHVEVC